MVKYQTCTIRLTRTHSRSYTQVVVSFVPVAFSTGMAIKAAAKKAVREGLGTRLLSGCCAYKHENTCTSPWQKMSEFTL